MSTPFVISSREPGQLSLDYVPAGKLEHQPRVFPRARRGNCYNIAGKLMEAIEDMAFQWARQQHQEGGGK